MRREVVVTERVVDAATRDRLLRARDDMVLERETAPGRFDLVEGPFHEYSRTIEVRGETALGTEIVQTLEYRAAMAGFGAMFARPIRRQMADLSGDRPWPWWSPPERQSARVSEMVALLSALAFVVGYAISVTTQTMTFAVDEFGVSDAAQGNALAAVRIGVLMSLGLLVIADRRGRRMVLLATVTAACVAAATGAIVPNIELLAGTQTITRGLATTASILLGVVAAEEVGPRSRAYAVSMLVMMGGAGAFLSIMLLPVAGIDDWTWRLLFLVPLLFLPMCRSVARVLPESRRFTAADALRRDDEVRRTPAARRQFRNRLLLLAAAGFIHASFQAPTNQLLNDFLKDERGFSASGISGFRMATSLPGILGIVVGGKLAEVYGRRLVGAVAVLIGGATTVLTYNSEGAVMWLVAVVSIVFSAATVPALGVYGPELFPTSLRGRANAVITTITVAGSATGLVIAGQLDDRYGGLGRGVVLLGIAPLIVVVMIALLYPETANRELEDINPEDASTRGLLDP
ncbi:MAG: MFS transporter [Acidimicrobiales bacterium]